MTDEMANIALTISRYQNRSQIGSENMMTNIISHHNASAIVLTDLTIATTNVAVAPAAVQFPTFMDAWTDSGGRGRC